MHGTQACARALSDLAGRRCAVDAARYCYKNPFNLLLTLPAAVSGVTGDVEAAVVISAMEVLLILLRFVQKESSNSAAERLKATSWYSLSRSTRSLRRVYDADCMARQGLLPSGWLVVELLTQTLIVHMICTAKWPLVDSGAAWPLMLTPVAVMATGVFVLRGRWLAISTWRRCCCRISFGYWLLACYAAMATVLKRVYIRKFGW